MVGWKRFHVTVVRCASNAGALDVEIRGCNVPELCSRSGGIFAELCRRMSLRSASQLKGETAAAHVILAGAQGYAGRCQCELGGEQQCDGGSRQSFKGGGICLLITFIVFPPKVNNTGCHYT